MRSIVMAHWYTPARNTRDPRNSMGGYTYCPRCGKATLERYALYGKTTIGCRSCGWEKQID